jgi:all-trans-8'-apo-beta-carotenal 15,15'-oxygenase
MAMPMANVENSAARPAPRCLSLLGISEQGGRDEAPAIEGEIPRELRGSLYRNGPGLFERGGLRKPHLLDGDGLVQRLSFADGAVHYRNAFVRTAKFMAEEKAEAYRFATWSMRRPGGMLANLGGGSVHSQAGVTVYPFKDILYALDEISPAYGVDPQTLETIGEQALGDPAREFMIKAHTKFDPLTGEWLLFGISHGRSMQKHDVAYLTAGTVNYGVNTGVKRVDYLKDKRQVFDFGAEIMAGEPVFAARPGAARDQGWLIVQCLDGRSERAFFALFDAAHLDAGPIARIHLPHHLPISFHGWWKAN